MYVYERSETAASSKAARRLKNPLFANEDVVVQRRKHLRDPGFCVTGVIIIIIIIIYGLESAIVRGQAHARSVAQWFL